MKNYSKDELQEMAKGYFESENTDVIHATSDGQFFVKESFQKRHADGNDLAKYTFYSRADRSEKLAEVPAGAGQQVTVAELAKLVSNISSVDDLKKMVETEQKGQNRASAVGAIEARIRHLSLIAELAAISDASSLNKMKDEALKGKRQKEVKLIEERLEQLSK